MKPRHQITYTQNIPYYGNNTKIVSIVVDKNFTQQDKNSISDAIKTWNYALNGNIVLRIESYNFDMEIETIKEIVASHGLIIMKIDHTSKLIEDKENTKTLAWVNGIGGTKMWVIRDRIDAEDLYPIMLHELGHVLGAAHEENTFENKNYLMFPYYRKESYFCVDKRAVFKVSKYQNISMEKLNYCVSDIIY